MEQKLSYFKGLSINLFGSKMQSNLCEAELEAEFIMEFGLFGDIYINHKNCNVSTVQESLYYRTGFILILVSLKIK